MALAQQSLKPCPFCGSEAELHQTEGCDHVVTCNGCGAQMFDDMKWNEDGYDSKVNVAQKWNARK